MSQVFKPSARALIIVAASIALACENGQFFAPDLSGAVVTVVDSGSALQSARTFVLPDTIVQLPQTMLPMRHDADAEVTTAIREHLVGLGWRDLGANATEADVVVLVAAATRIQTGVVYTDWYSAWGYLPYWGAGVDASWAWGAPAGIPYAFPAGTLLISMLDLRGKNVETKSFPLLWAAVIDGVVTTATSTAQRAIFGIDQAFAQSDYLRVP